MKNNEPNFFSSFAFRQKAARGAILIFSMAIVPALIWAVTPKFLESLGQITEKLNPSGNNFVVTKEAPSEPSRFSYLKKLILFPSPKQ